MTWWNSALTPSCGVLRAPADGSIVSITVCLSPGMLINSGAALVPTGALGGGYRGIAAEKGLCCFLPSRSRNFHDFTAAFC